MLLYAAKTNAVNTLCEHHNINYNAATKDNTFEKEIIKLHYLFSLYWISMKKESNIIDH